MPGNPSPKTACVLCGGSDIAFFFEDNLREYLKCLSCDLVFVPAYQRLTREEEAKRYSLHQNDPEDKGYKHFLGRMFNPMKAFAPSGSCGLDFGSGPNPVLSRMFIEQGYKMEIYDPFYARNRSVFNKKYDFITATEVFEHLFYPGKEVDLLWSCLKPGGALGIMTKLIINKDSFANWHYKEDRSHVSFFSRKTFMWLEKRLNADSKFIEDDIIIFCKHHSA